jgi:hypothetical protein
LLQNSGKINLKFLQKTLTHSTPKRVLRGDRALYLLTFSHLLIVNKLSLSLSLPAEEPDESGLRKRRDDRSTPYHSHCLVRACVCAFVGEFAHVSIHSMHTYCNLPRGAA